MVSKSLPLCTVDNYVRRLFRGGFVILFRYFLSTAILYIEFGMFMFVEVSHERQLVHLHKDFTTQVQPFAK